MKPPSVTAPDQQPLQRVVGRRVARAPGAVPDAAARAAMTRNARYLTRVPKGVYMYKSHDEMTRDRDRWTVDLIVARATQRDGGSGSGG